MPGQDLHLLALDGGGIRGLSSLIILKQLMETINPDSPPKPCDYFDMIGGTSTGGWVIPLRSSCGVVKPLPSCRSRNGASGLDVKAGGLKYERREGEEGDKWRDKGFEGENLGHMRENARGVCVSLLDRI